MENASKALIIAGAILLAIVIISLGLIVVNNTRNTIDNTNLSEQEIQNFNAKFTAYEGANVSASRVNTLIQQVISTNQATADSGSTDFVCIGFPSITKTSSTSGDKDYVYISMKLNSSTNKYELSGSSAVVLDKSNYTKAITKKSHIKSSGVAVTYALSVETGKTYTVNMEYSNGLVQGIIVLPN